MTDFETHPVGTADLVKRLRSYQEFEQNRDGQIVCIESEIANEAADRIEQLVATVEPLETALTRANAATAAAYEVAAQIADDFVRMREQQIETEKAKDALYINVPRIMRWQAGKVQSKAIADDIRALATPDQTAALDKLIAEAVEPYVEALRVLISHTHECERELTEALYHADFCGESGPLTDARAILAALAAAKAVQHG